MKKIVWTFGLIAGAILAALMFITVPFLDQLGDLNYVIGYTSMILAFLMVYFGIRSYRDNVMAGVIRFGRAFQVGILITLIASACYVAAWEIIYHTMMPDFAEKYAAQQVAQARTAGATEAQIQAKTKAMASFLEAYKNPLLNVGMTFAEVFPVGVVVVLVSAGALSRRKAGADPAAARG